MAVEVTRLALAHQSSKVVAEDTQELTTLARQHLVQPADDVGGEVTDDHKLQGRHILSLWLDLGACVAFLDTSLILLDGAHHLIVEDGRVSCFEVHKQVRRDDATVGHHALEILVSTA